MLEYLLIILAIPLGLTLAKYTEYEKKIYSKSQYFPTFLVVLFIFSVYFFITKNNLTITTSFIFVMTLSWLKS